MTGDPKIHVVSYDLSGNPISVYDSATGNPLTHAVRGVQVRDNGEKSWGSPVIAAHDKDVIVMQSNGKWDESIETKQVAGEAFTLNVDARTAQLVGSARLDNVKIDGTNLSYVYTLRDIDGKELAKVEGAVDCSKGGVENFLKSGKPLVNLGVFGNNLAADGSMDVETTNVSLNASDIQKFEAQPAIVGGGMSGRRNKPAITLTDTEDLCSKGRAMIDPQNPDCFLNNLEMDKTLLVAGTRTHLAVAAPAAPAAGSAPPPPAYADPDKSLKERGAAFFAEHHNDPKEIEAELAKVGPNRATAIMNAYKAAGTAKLDGLTDPQLTMLGGLLDDYKTKIADKAPPAPAPAPYVSTETTSDQDKAEFLAFADGKGPKGAVDKNVTDIEMIHAFGDMRKAFLKSHNVPESEWKDANPKSLTDQNDKDLLMRLDKMYEKVNAHAKTNDKKAFELDPAEYDLLHAISEKTKHPEVKTAGGEQTKDQKKTDESAHGDTENHVEKFDAKILRMQKGLQHLDIQQYKLEKHGADGKLGPETRAVLRHWAEAHHVPLPDKDLTLEYVTEQFKKAEHATKADLKDNPNLAAWAELEHSADAAEKAEHKHKKHHAHKTAPHPQVNGAGTLSVQAQDALKNVDLKWATDPSGQPAFKPEEIKQLHQTETNAVRTANGLSTEPLSPVDKRIEASMGDAYREKLGFKNNGVNLHITAASWADVQRTNTNVAAQPKGQGAAGPNGP